MPGRVGRSPARARTQVMATATHKQKLVSQLLAAQGKIARAGEAAERPVLEQFLFAVCREGVTREVAEQAYAALKGRFFDWNEVRVSAPEEVAELLDGLLPDALLRAQRIIDLLQEVFETTFSFDLEPLQKKGVKQAARQLSRYQAANDYAVAFVVQQSLGGHALPLDEPSIRVLQRLGLIDEQGLTEEARASLEHQVPKTKGTLFLDLVSALAATHCAEEQPNCPRCPVRGDCATAAASRPAASSKKPR